VQSKAESTPKTAAPTAIVASNRLATNVKGRVRIREAAFAAAPEATLSPPGRLAERTRSAHAHPPAGDVRPYAARPGP
jgi:hypothetical protein